MFNLFAIIAMPHIHKLKIQENAALALLVNAAPKATVDVLDVLATTAVAQDVQNEVQQQYGKHVETLICFCFFEYFKVSSIYQNHLFICQIKFYI